MNADTKEWLNADFERKMVKAAALLINRPEYEVGTTPSEVVYEDGKMRLLHYLPPNGGEQCRVPVLVVYALINKPYILDLQPDRSVVGSLMSKGLDVYLIDWGTPTDSDRWNTLNDYVSWYMNDAVDCIRRRHGLKSISVLGYCMGGTLSVMFAALYPEKVKNLILMASPLDFEADDGLLRHWAQSEYFDVDKFVDAFGNVSGQFLNMGYMMLDPLNNLFSKYLRLIDMVDDEEFIKLFFRMEKWIYDGIPIAGEAYREFIKYCYQQNLLVKSQLKLGRRKVNLGKLKMPLLNIVAECDNLVPMSSGVDFADLVPSTDKKTFMFKTGHIGLSVGASSHSEMWPKVADWLRKRSNEEPKDEPKPKKERPTRRKASRA